MGLDCVERGCKITETLVLHKILTSVNTLLEGAYGEPF